MFNTIQSFKFYLLVCLLLPLSVGNAKKINGFELDNAAIPPTQIFSGGPEKDGIPAIDQPGFIKARDVEFLKNSDRVLGITVNGVSKAYPISILNWHEIVNDSIGDVFFVITYCPLCGSGMAFDSRIDGNVLSFGVSGLLYNSDVLLYDRETESLWSQLMIQAVTGKYKGTVLTTLPVIHTIWSDWKRLHPSTLVLSKNTGNTRDYSRDPYSGYEQSQHLFFPVSNTAPEKFHPKEKVLGLMSGNVYKAYPFVELNKNGKEKFIDVLDGKSFTVYWNKKAQSGYVSDESGIVVPVVQSYWFAWYAFHPETEVFMSTE